MTQPAIRRRAVAYALAVALVACLAGATPAAQGADPKAEAQQFIDQYTERYTRLRYEHSLADWQANTYIVEGDESNAKAASAALERLAAFTGSKQNIETARKLLTQKSELSPSQVKQLERILYIAADSPQTAADVVKKRIAAETTQVQKLYGFDFKIGGRSVTPNQIDDILKTSTNLDERLAAWNASKEVGRELKGGLETLRDLRNATVRPLGFDSYFNYQVSDYRMTDAEMLALMDRVNRELRPLYRELHTWARYELAKRYNAPVPDQIPAHWLPNRWGQDWSALVEVEGANANEALKDKSPEWIVRQAEEFYVSLGWPRLPQSFYDRSSLYTVPAGEKYKKNTHASAWHLDLENDIRSLMSVESNAEWYETTHHELGHVYYYVSYTTPEVPHLLRGGANRAYHEAIGSLMGLASMQQPFLEARGLAPKGANVDPNLLLLREALNFVVFIPFSTGTMTRFEHDLYAENLSADRFNARWWELAGKYQGIAPPSQRGSQFCDACTKTHVIDDPAQYYDYALSNVLLFQLHDHIARNILKQDPRATNYYGNKAVGDFLRDIMRHGAARDWNEVLREKTGEDLSAKAMLRYFEPLTAYLKKANEGRKYTLPEV